MLIRLFYMRSAINGFCVADSYEVDALPRVGDRVFLPAYHVDVIAENEPALRIGSSRAPKRYDVVGVEHRWDQEEQVVHVQIARMVGRIVGS
ncbi:MAG: hypothetical protein ABJZ55_20330 [Fuerstiella sp.]